MELASEVNRRTVLRILALAGASVTVGANGMISAASASAAGGTVWPNGTTTIPTISSPFGPRGPHEGTSGFHYGVDFVGFSTAHVVEGGTVLALGWIPGWNPGGYQVLVQHLGFTSRYLHLVNGSGTVSVGQKITAGTPIGTVGNTGGNYEVHLHLEINPASTQIDPVPFLANRISAPRPVAPAGEGMEAVVNTPNGTIVHLRVGGKTNFESSDEYNKFRAIVAFLVNRQCADMMLLPPLDQVPNVTWDTFILLCQYFGAPDK